MKLVLALFVSLTWINAEELDAQIEACHKDDVASCYKAGIALTTGKNAEDQEKKNMGLEYIRKACKFGEEKACDVLGDNYYIDKHYQAARPYLENACNRGIVTACEAMGTMYRLSISTLFLFSSSRSTFWYLVGTVNLCASFRSKSDLNSVK